MSMGYGELQLENTDALLAKDITKGKRQIYGAIAAPLVTPVIPAIVTLVIFVLFGGTPPTAAVILFFGFISILLAFIAGLAASGVLAVRRNRLHKSIRERISARGIRAGEIEWFRSEIRSSEWRSLSEITRKDLLLGDAYRETLASRLTASQITKSSSREQSRMQKRLNRISQLKAANADDLKKEIGFDIDRIKSINMEAKQMLAEAESRLQMIEAASVRGTSIADSALALKKLSARAAALPLALESARIDDDILREIEEVD